MKQFFGTVRDSVYNPTFYTSLATRPISFSIKYVFKLSLLAMILVGVIGSLKFVPLAREKIGEIPEKIGEWYPQELVITIKDSKVSTNVTEPYFIELPSEFTENASLKEEDPSHLVVIDTKTPFSIEQFDAYDSLIWLTKDSLIAKDNNAGVKITSLQGIPDTVVDRKWAEEIGTQLQSLFTALPVVIIPIAMVFIGFFWVVFHFVYLFIAALFVWLVQLIMKVKTSYGIAYRAATHAMTLPLIVFGLAYLIFGWKQPTFLFSATLLIIVVLNYLQKPQTEMALEVTPE